MAEQLIIRRRRRWFVGQMAVGFVIAVIAVVLAAIVAGRAGATLASVIAAAALSLAGLVQWRELCTSPRAFVATADHLALLSPNGHRHYARWEEVGTARHATSFRGMCWSLETQGGKVILADLGVDPDRWGVLWRSVTYNVLKHGGNVRVDALSNAIYDSSTA